MSSPQRYRSVTDLRIQYTCEFRLYLRELHGDQDAEWRRKGVALHQRVSSNEMQQPNRNTIIKWILLLVIIITSILWVMG